MTGGDQRPFGVELILAEEGRRERGGMAATDGGGTPAVTRPVESDRTIRIERRSFDATEAFVPQDDSHEFPISGPGTLSQFLLVTGQTDYDLTVTADGGTVWSDNFNTLKSLSSELAGISADVQGGNNVLDVQNVEFTDELSIVVRPGGTLSVTRQRAVLVVERARDEGGAP